MSLTGKRRTRRPWFFVFTLLLTCVLLFFALRGVDWHEMLITAQQGDLRLGGLAVLILSFSYFLRGMRWRVLLSNQKDFSPLMAFWGICVGYLGNNFLPARVGEIIRSVMVGRRLGISKSYVLATVLTERVIDAMTLAVFGGLAFSFLENTPSWLERATISFGGMGVLGLLALFIVPRLEGLLIPFLKRLPMPGGVRIRAVDLFAQFLKGMRAFHNVNRVLRFMALTTVIWLVDALTAIVVAMSFGFVLTLPQAAVLLAALGLASALPSTPGYLGIYQFVAVTVLKPFGLNQNQALVFILAFQAVIYIVVVLWGLLGLWRLRVSKTSQASDGFGIRAVVSEEQQE